MSEPNSAFKAKLDAFGALCNQEGFTGSENATDAANDARQALLDAYAGVVATVSDQESLLVSAKVMMRSQDERIAELQSDLAAAHQLRRDEVASLIDKHNKVVEENERLKAAIRGSSHTNEFGFCQFRSDGNVCRTVNNCTPENCIWLQVKGVK